MGSYLKLLSLAALLTIVSTQTPEEQLAKRNGEFALNTYRKLGEQTEGNLFFSPLSISMAMGMLYLGAKHDTETQMADVLKFSGLSDVHGSFKQLRNILMSSEEFDLHTANRLYGRNDFTVMQEFLDQTAVNYGAQLQTLDFIHDPEGSRQTINEWVESQTNQKIQDLLPAGLIKPSTVMVLVNAIYFKGMWETQFNQSLTAPEMFHLGGGKASIPMNMMRKRKEKFMYKASSELNANLLSLPYKGDQLDLVIVLPTEVDGLTSLESSLTMDKLLTALDDMRQKEINTLLIPKFKLIQEANLVNTFQALGLNVLFDPRADLSGISGHDNLFVSDVVHKAYIDVNEQGTEAAASTAIGIVLTSIQLEQTNFIVDHPFMFFIRDKTTNSILFLGRMNQAPDENGDIIGDGLIRKVDSSCGAIPLFSLFLLPVVLMTYTM